MSQDILQTILQQKQKDLELQKKNLPLQELQRQVIDCPPARDFLNALQQKILKKQPAVIAEVKKASPSKGIIQPNFDPIATALDYAKQGATCLSVLTDEPFFQGKDEYLVEIKNVVSLPLLRKDFIIDEYQIYQSKILGADCILLIVAALNDQQLMQYCALAQDLGMAVLVESHDAKELQRALPLPTPLMGINNRNLRTFETTLQTTLDLLPFIPDNKCLITESGIQSKADMTYMLQHGIYGFLIGESLMRGDWQLS